MNVALIDSGISHAGDLKGKITSIVKFVGDEKDNAGTRNSMPVHGTICAEIINSICPDVHFLDLHALYQDGTTQTSILTRALHWCVDNKIKLIHMSLGTVNYFDIKPLAESIKKLIKQNAIIVAAYHNNNIRTYPAVLPGVFGVRQDCYGILEENQYLIQEKSGLNRENSIIAHWWGHNRGNPVNSYAAPVVTGYIADYLKSKPEADFYEILNFLEEGAICGKIYPGKVEKVIRKEKIETPVIAGVGLYHGEIPLLADLLQERGYQALILQECLTNHRAIPIKYYNAKDVSLAHIIYTVNLIYKPDIILFEFHSDTMYHRAKASDIDIYVTFKDKIYKIYAEKLIGTTKEQSKICDIICQYYE